MAYPYLLSPLTIGNMRLPNRVVMAPLTRLRNSEGDIPNPMMAEYYTQRASAGMIITEATDISATAKGYAGAPGVHNPAQVAGWKMIADSVHQAGGRIGIQIWHTGLVSHYSLQPNGQQPVSASNVDLGDIVRTSLRDKHGQVTRRQTTPAREATRFEIKQIIDDYANAARLAIQAGMDFVEIHGAHGYLIHQFLYDSVNQRIDEYGGDMAQRLTFLKEVITAVVNAVGKDRVGIRISPLGVFNGVAAGSEADALAVVKAINDFGLAYVHFSEPDWAGGKPFSMEFRQQVRQIYQGVIIGSGAYTAQKADDLIRQGLIDAAAFGRAFIANPDLPARFAVNAPLNEPKPATFYGGNEKGYTDYPTMK